VTVQNFGINEGVLFASLPSTISAGTLNVFEGGATRIGFALLLAGLVVAVQWFIFRLTTMHRREQSVPAYIMMIVVGALVAAGTLSGVAYLGGNGVPLSLSLVLVLHYLIFITIIQTSIGVIGSRMSTSAKQAEDALTKLNEQERRFVVSEERARRIAAEFLHDRVQADLLVIAMELRRVAEDAPEDLARRIASITEGVETVRRSDVRDTSRSLSPMVQATGLASALTVLADRWAPAMRVSVYVAPGIGNLEPHGGVEDPDRALGIYRIVEQALLNAAAHGHAEQAQVSVTEQMRDGQPWVRVHVTDDGAGFDPASADSGGGFATSQVWARLLNGQWSVESQPGNGATVTGWIPAD
jgi:signal transduction histidine kinase